MDSRARLRYAVVFIRGPVLPSGTRVALSFGTAETPDIVVTCTARWTTNDGTGLQFEGLGTIDTHMRARFVRVAARPTARIRTDAVLRRTQS